MKAMTPKYIQVQPSWDCSLHDRRGDNLPGRLVLDTEKLKGFKRAWQMRQNANLDAVYNFLAKYLKTRYGFSVVGMSFCPVSSRRGIPGMI